MIVPTIHLIIKCSGQLILMTKLGDFNVKTNRMQDLNGTSGNSETATKFSLRVVYTDATSLTRGSCV